ncbi:oxidoreductase [Basfia succiniciproducens]|uniref:Aspartate-semialdehyde dehydrogenase n=1 Tax=Basfia succiniciproducens TaxID=653940 RepID=A0A1G5ABZ3_9PAST|nr:oxidoreductase [Basfia succiniciproducens]QIM68482.1 aspartate-semialdehyde dehydrogenase [Basfia succiniciproducens]SCX75402.1 Aspartate-semialdehyde dehydrogenase [Basfia succiniciproducens]
MSTSLNIAIAANFDLCEKIASYLEESLLEVEKLSIVEIYPFSEEQGIRFNGKAVAQLPVDEVEWSDFNYLFFAGDLAHIPLLAKASEAGCLTIEMNGVCSALADVPVVIPGVNEEQLRDLRQRNIVSLPDAQVTQFALSVRSLLNNASNAQIVVSSLLPASYYDADGVHKLVGQTAKLLNGIPPDEEEMRFAFDVFPAKSLNLNAQLQRVFPQLENVVFHQIHVPVFYGLAQMVTVKAEFEPEQDSILAEWSTNDFIRYHQDKVMTPVLNGEAENHEDEVHLQISALESVEGGIQYWLVADNQRFSQAFLAVKLLESIYRQGY